MDYRCSSYCKLFSDIENKKINFSKKFKIAHPRAKNHYEYIKQRNGQFKKDFLEIFNYKCAYCGNSIYNLSIDLFEIDHFISKSYYENENDAGKINNLVSACQSCNSLKKNFINTENYFIFDVETGLPKLFERDSDFYIRVKNEFENNSLVKGFYEQLHLGYQTKRIDYVLMELYGMINDEKIKLSSREKMTEIYTILKKKRSFFSNYA